MRFCLLDKPERWRRVSGYGNFYFVSELGRVWSLRKGGRMLRPGIASNGYPTVALGRKNTRTLHSLVANSFIGPCPSGMEVRHKDGCRTNPEFGNLEYGTRTDNIFDAVRHGTWNRSEPLKKAWETRRLRYGIKGVRHG